MKTWKKLKQNPGLFDRYFIRERIIKNVRSFFDNQNFHEVETPILVEHPPAESYIEIFETALLDRNRNPYQAYLSTSPEVALKKLLVAGIGNCYAITKSFRNMETNSYLHNPEFTILEWYRVGANYKEIMNDCEELFFHLADFQKTIQYQGMDIDISPPWERLTIKEAFRRWANVDFDLFLEEENAREIATKKGYRVNEGNTWEELYNQIFLNEIEPHLGKKKPVILYEFPGAMGALARKKPDDPRYAERFEFYIAGLELGDCYSELTDPVEQEERFKNEIEEIQRRGRTVYEYDHDFIDALHEGLPECSGIAVGLDRVIMIFANVSTIQDTLFFPWSEV
ncbi:MAG: EF-P lysine aminoacylase EpmA [Patescibacteria group bacterium]|nr:EF-P lysine aminoacylase EpmA [Patescibacteria group bacterium]